jgi:hypothetical protein
VTIRRYFQLGRAEDVRRLIAEPGNVIPHSQQRLENGMDSEASLATIKKTLPVDIQIDPNAGDLY